ncbi:serine hydrolase domain-containing protein [Taklimakanibacter lacteus]|uniref:serine hydrolase domain-containing protein n=1 Tax=Taklimakanibacter lacteus TaxID=2268456 RepID=UPI000E6705E8
MFTRLQNVIDNAVARGCIVGVVFLVARDGEIVFATEKGFADREAGVPVRRDTIFRLASVTKPFVAMAALAMADRGRIRLEDPVRLHLPYFRPRLADGTEPLITLRHLLTHTSGLSYDYPDADFSDGLSDTDFGFEENFTRLAKRPLKFAPGSSWEYSVAIDVLGAVLAAVEETTLNAVVRRYVNDPLGIAADTGFAIADRSRLATAYADATPVAMRMPDRIVLGNAETGIFNFAPVRAFNPHAFQSGGAGMVGTAPDVLRLLEALRMEGTPVLRPETWRAAVSNQIGALPRESEPPGQRFGYLSAIVSDPKAAATPQSAGTLNWGGVYGNDWYVDIAKGLSVVSLSNTALEGCNGQFVRDTRDALYADLAS